MVSSTFYFFIKKLGLRVMPPDTRIGEAEVPLRFERASSLLIFSRIRYFRWMGLIPSGFFAGDTFLKSKSLISTFSISCASYFTLALRRGLSGTYLRGE